MFTDDKPHRRYGTSYSVAFWKNNVASDQGSADRACLEVGSPGMPYPTFQFKWPEEKYQLERMEAALDKAYERGRHAGKKEIRDALGVAEPR